MRCVCEHTVALHTKDETVGPCRRKVCACEAWQPVHDEREGYHVPTVATEHPYTTVWTDGSSTGAWGAGGWGWCVLDGPNAGREAHGGHPDTTNQRMEIQAAHEALRALPGLLLIVSDSQYVVRCFTEQWHIKWAARDYDKVKNSDLWLPFVVDYLLRDGEVRFAWVKGHQGMPGNERADVLAKQGKAENSTPVAPPVDATR